MIKDKLFIFMVTLFIILAFSTILGLNKYRDNQNLLIQDHKNLVKNCNKSDKNELSEDEINFCNKLTSSDLSEYKLNAYDGYEIYIVDYLRTYLNEFIIIAVILIGSSYYVTKYLKNRIILNEINRKKYKNIIKQLFFSSWKYALLIPLMLLITFIIVYFYIGVNGFSIGLDELSGTIFENKLLIYFLIILIQSFILSMIYININLFISKKENTYILSVIKSYISVIGLEILFEMIISPLLFKLFNLNIGVYLNIINIYNYTNLTSNLNNLFVLFIIMIISFIPLYFRYKNKENLIISSEKNDNS